MRSPLGYRIRHGYLMGGDDMRRMNSESMAEIVLILIGVYFLVWLIAGVV